MSQPVEIPAAQWLHLTTLAERAIRNAREALALFLVFNAQAEATAPIILPAGQTENGSHRFVKPDEQLRARADAVYQEMLLNLADALKFTQQLNEGTVPVLAQAGLVKIAEKPGGGE